MRPLHAPPPISWWPPAPGWWLVLAVVLLAVLLGLRWWRNNAPKRAALRELKSVQSLVQDPVHLAAAVNRLLKRYALMCWPRSETAALTGEAWLAFLDAHGGQGKIHPGTGSAADASSLRFTRCLRLAKQHGSFGVAAAGKRLDQEESAGKEEQMMNQADGMIKAMRDGVVLFIRPWSGR